MLHLLASCPGRVFGREELLERVLGYSFAGNTRTVDVHVNRLRQKQAAHGLPEDLIPRSGASATSWSRPPTWTRASWAGGKLPLSPTAA